MKREQAIRDEELIKAHLQGSAHAFSELVMDHASDLTSMLERMVNDHHLALDLAQDVFIKVHGMLPKYKFNGRFRSLLYTIAINHGRDAIRKKKRSPLVYLEKPVSVDSGDPFEQYDLQAKIELALDRVPNPFREAMYLRDVTGLSYQEAARVLKCSLGTVKSRVNRGRLAFRDIFTELSKKEGEQNAS